MDLAAHPNYIMKQYTEVRSLIAFTLSRCIGSLCGCGIVGLHSREMPDKLATANNADCTYGTALSVDSDLSHPKLNTIGRRSKQDHLNCESVHRFHGRLDFNPSKVST